MKSIISKIRMQKLAGILKEDATVDQILDKINISGIDSLSPKEKNYLSRYSKEIDEDKVIEYAKIMAYSSFYIGTLKNTPWSIYDDTQDYDYGDDFKDAIKNSNLNATMDYDFSLYAPFSQTWGPVDEYDNTAIPDKPEQAYLEITKLYNNYPNPDFIVTNKIFNIKSPTCPGAPFSAYGTLIEINTPDKTEVTISTPAFSSNGKYKVGWFDSNGKYHADTKNFDKNLNFIG
jgi:hypothetical protein